MQHGTSPLERCFVEELFGPVVTLLSTDYDDRELIMVTLHKSSVTD